MQITYNVGRPVAQGRVLVFIRPWRTTTTTTTTTTTATSAARKSRAFPEFRYVRTASPNLGPTNSAVPRRYTFIGIHSSEMVWRVVAAVY